MIAEMGLDGIKDVETGNEWLERVFIARQHLDGKWSVCKDGEKIATHRATALREPLCQWKRRNGKLEIKGRETVQVYIASKPASTEKGTF